MPVPMIGYPAPVPGHPKQSIPRSDWPIYAAVTALSTMPRELSDGPSDTKIQSVLRSWLNAQDIPNSRLDLWLEALASTPGTISTPVPPPVPEPEPGKYVKVPDPYQFYAANEMSCAGGVFALGCGLGKTLTTEIVIDSLAKKYAGKPLILTSTKTALEGDAWDPYLPRFRKMGFSEVFVVSIDSLHKFEPGFPSNGGVLVIDEGHLLGAGSARRTKHAMALRLKVDYCLLLSGTMFHGGVSRAMTTLNLAIPGNACFASLMSAASYFNCIKEVRYQDNGKEVVRHKIVRPGGEDAKRFQEFIQTRHVVSLAKTSPLVRQSLTIPDQDQFIVEFDGPWGTVHHDSVQEIKRAMSAGEGIPHAAAVAAKLARSGLGSKISWILDKVSNGDPLVIFAQYHESLNEIERRLRAEDIGVVRVDGLVTGPKRSEAIAAFQSGAVQVFLGQIEAAGISVELTRAHISVATDVSRRPDVYDQALARTCRRGQTHRCAHYDLVANRYQVAVVETVRAGKVFDASITEYQDVVRARSESLG